MKSFRDFDKALAEFRESGGCMLVDLSGSKDMWLVGDSDTVREMTLGSCLPEETSPTLREITEIAMSYGKMSDEQIKEELQD